MIIIRHDRSSIPFGVLASANMVIEYNVSKPMPRLISRSLLIVSKSRLGGIGAITLPTVISEISKLDQFY